MQVEFKLMNHNQTNAMYSDGDNALIVLPLRLFPIDPFAIVLPTKIVIDTDAGQGSDAISIPRPDRSGGGAE